MKQGVASIQENWRTTYTIPVKDVIADISAGVLPQIWVFRQAFLASSGGSVVDGGSAGTAISVDDRSATSAAAPSSATAPLTYSTLLQQMMTVRLAAPYYVVIAGTASGEGAVIARNQTSVEGTY